MFKIIFEDQYILVVDKPAGLVVTPSETQKEISLAQILQKEYGISLERGGVVHRLDKDTSGLLVVAKTTEAFDNLQGQFKERKVKKEYLSLVHGLVEGPGKIEGSIGRNPGDREKFTVIASGKEAVTEYQPIKRLEMTDDRLQEIFSDYNKIQMRKLNTLHYNLYTLLRCYPKTGRTHQIRVHLKHIGFPIVADEKYVGRKMYRLDHRWAGRQFLHAAKIGFFHPITGEWLEFESPMPEDLEKALNYLNG